MEETALNYFRFSDAQDDWREFNEISLMPLANVQSH